MFDQELSDWDGLRVFQALGVLRGIRTEWTGS